MTILEADFDPNAKSKMKGQDVLFSSDSDEWRTPRDLFDPLQRKFNFTMDIAATRENSLCEYYLTKEQDALKHIDRWHDRVWCNPPYSIWQKFAEAAHSHACQGGLCVMLIPSRTDTKAFHLYIDKIWHVQFLKGRLKFSGSKNSAPFPSMLVYFGVLA